MFSAVESSSSPFKKKKKKEFQLRPFEQRLSYVKSVHSLLLLTPVILGQAMWIWIYEDGICVAFVFIK